MDRIKRLSYEVLDKHKSKFNESFSDNKKTLDKVAIIRSKGLKNEITGYITKFIKNEKRDEELKQSQIEEAKELTNEETSEIAISANDSEETIIEVGVDPPETGDSLKSNEDKTE